MAKTPEGEVKKMIDERLAAKGLIPASKAERATEQHTGKFVKPVPSPLGVMGIPDYYGHYKGWFFEIEAKIVGKDPTPLQKQQLKATAVTGGASFVVRCADDFEAVEDWMAEIDVRMKTS